MIEEKFSLITLYSATTFWEIIRKWKDLIMKNSKMEKAESIERSRERNLERQEEKESQKILFNEKYRSLWAGNWLHSKPRERRILKKRKLILPEITLSEREKKKLIKTPWFMMQPNFRSDSV